MKASHALLAAAVAQQATATWNLFAKPLTSPNYNNNECSEKQKGGFDWSDLKDGDSNFQYGDFDFSAGWKCSNAFGKRDSLTKRTFGNKAIVNKCSKQKPATFGCDKRKEGFSITTIDVSVEFDVEVDLHYTMGDGSLCKQRSVPCKKEGSTITNTQCGGAKSVQVYLGSSYKGSKSDCQIGFHHIGFDCNPGKPYTPPSPPTYSAPPSPPSPPSPPKESSPPSPPSPPTPPKESSPPSPPSPPTPPKESAPPAPPASSGCGGEGYGAGCPPAQTPPVNSPPYNNVSTHLPPPPPPPTYQTTVVAPPPVHESSSAVYAPATSTGVASPPSPPSNKPSPPPQPSPPSKGGDVPPQLPQCMNTWLQISTEDCKDNTAVDCYCKNSKFTKNVIDCVQAWCETDEQTKQALQYLVGICASYVPENPGIVSDCPKDTFNPPKPPAGGAGSSPGAAAPSPAPPMQGPPVTTVTYGSYAVTVPQVHFTTPSPVAGDTKPSAPVGLVPGNAPPAVPAITTGAPYPVPSTLRPSSFPTGTGAVRPSSPAQFTGAASPFRVDAKQAMLGAALAFLAL